MSAVTGVFMRLQAAHGFVIVAFSDLRYGHAAKIFVENAVNEVDSADHPAAPLLDRCADRSRGHARNLPLSSVLHTPGASGVPATVAEEHAGIKAAFVLPEALTQMNGGVAYVKSTSPTLFVTIQATPAGLDNQDDSSDSDIFEFVQGILSDHGQLMSFSIIRNPNVDDQVRIWKYCASSSSFKQFTYPRRIIA